jgi:glycerol-3-phosphate O-acyltransferase 3/4
MQLENQECQLKTEKWRRRRDLLDISPLVQDAAAAIVDDSFLRCFQSQSSDPWNWNIYLAPLWAVGLVVRYVILFPLRCARIR